MCEVNHLCAYIVFFFKQKTAYESLISDWSSDVCSSDLDSSGAAPPAGADVAGRWTRRRLLRHRRRLPDRACADRGNSHAVRLADVAGFDIALVDRKRVV